MGLSLQNMRNGILAVTGTDLTDWENGNTDLDLYLNRSWWDIMDQFDFREKESDLLTFDTVASDYIYDLVAELSPIEFESLQGISIAGDTDDEPYMDLILISEWEFENKFIPAEANEAKPTRYFRRGTNIYLWEIPDDVYTLRVRCLVTLDNLASGGPPIPQSWHEIIMMGGQYRALIDKRDFIQAKFILGEQKDKIRGRTPVEAKETVDTKKAGIEVLGREY